MNRLETVAVIKLKDLILDLRDSVLSDKRSYTDPRLHEFFTNKIIKSKRLVEDLLDIKESL